MKGGLFTINYLRHSKQRKYGLSQTTAFIISFEDA